MKVLLTLSMACATLVGGTTFADGPTINPNIRLDPVPTGGSIVTPSVTVTAPVGKGTVYGSASSSVYVSPTGSPTGPSRPSFNIGVKIPF